jgi:cyclophilin family peptidyl-prolyl cis-trans isomerase
MQLKSLFAIVAGLFLANLAAAQAVPPAPPPPAPTPENILHLDLSSGGRVSIQLRPDVAPNHVERVKTLARRGFYDDIVFHRVIEGFMAQTGDPTGRGDGGSELPDLTAEFNGLPHLRGSVAAARTNDPNSANSQFYIMFAPRMIMDGKYTVFGRVIDGMQYVDAIQRGEPPVQPTRILRASIGLDNIAPPVQPAAVASEADPTPQN